MKIATFGVFDIIHAGHIEFLKRCKSLSKDAELTVVLARDSTVLKDKGREPLIPEEQRKYILKSLKPVDKVILGNEGMDKLKIVEEIKPNIIILGYDQGWDEKKLEQELEKMGLKIKVFRLKKYGNINSTSIKNRIKFN